VVLLLLFPTANASTNIIWRWRLKRMIINDVRQEVSMGVTIWDLRRSTTTGPLQLVYSASHRITLRNLFFLREALGEDKIIPHSPDDVVENRILHCSADNLLGCQQVHRWAHSESSSCLLHVGTDDDDRKYLLPFLVEPLFFYSWYCSSQILHYNNSTLEDKPVKVRVDFMALVVHASQKSRLSITPRCWPDTRM
jgi:hypothetical protein